MDVLRDALGGGLPGGGANFFFYSFEATHLDSCGALGFVGRESTADFFFGCCFKKAVEFFVHFEIALFFGEERFDSVDEIFQDGHEDVSSRRRYS